jgi:hypothetical protein
VETPKGFGAFSADQLIRGLQQQLENAYQEIE